MFDWGVTDKDIIPSQRISSIKNIVNNTFQCFNKVYIFYKIKQTNFKQYYST